MLKFVLRKLTQGAIMLLAVSAITFALLSSAGGDALSSLRENPQVSERTIAELRSYYGLDRPLVVRYGSWLGAALRGDLGESLSYKTSVAGLTLAKFVYTAEMAAAAMAFCLVLSVGLGLAAARYKSPWVSAAVDGFIAFSASAPQIVVAVISLAIAARYIGGISQSPTVVSAQFILGALALALPLVSFMLGQLRASLSEADAADFVRLARAKGLDDWAVLLRHVVRAALNPFLTVAGLAVGALMGGSVIIETILGWPGLGVLMVNAVRTRDVPLVMGVVLVASLAVWVGNTAAEMLQALNDRRVVAVDPGGRIN